MTVINTKNGTVTLENETVLWRNRVTEGTGEDESNYNLLNPREHAAGILYNQNTLEISQYTGNNIFATPLKCVEFTDTQHYLYFAIGRKIYRYYSDERKVSVFFDGSDFLDDDDYFVDVTNYNTDSTSSDHYYHSGRQVLISRKGKGYAPFTKTEYDYYEQFIEIVGEDVEFTGVSSWYNTSAGSNTMIISTTKGLFGATGLTLGGLTRLTISGIPVDQSYGGVMLAPYGGSTPYFIALLQGEHNTVSAVYSPKGLITAINFKPVATAISERFHNFKAINESIDAVIFEEGVWFTENNTAAKLNTSDLYYLKDTQYISYIKQWVRISPGGGGTGTSDTTMKYSTNNLRWRNRQNFNMYGYLINTETVSGDDSLVFMAGLSPFFEDPDYGDCGIGITDSGEVQLLFKTSAYRLTNTVIDLNIQRTPKFKYQNIVGAEGDTVQDVMEELDGNIHEDGRVFNYQDILIPYSIDQPKIPSSSNYYYIGGKSRDVVMNYKNTYGFVYDKDLAILDIYNTETKRWTKCQLATGSTETPIDCPAVWSINGIWTCIKQGTALCAVNISTSGTIVKYKVPDAGTNNTQAYLATNGRYFYLAVRQSISDLYTVSYLDVGSSFTYSKISTAGSWQSVSFSINGTSQALQVKSIEDLRYTYGVDGTSATQAKSICYGVVDFDGVSGSHLLLFNARTGNSVWSSQEGWWFKYFYDGFQNSPLLKYGKYGSKYGWGYISLASADDNYYFIFFEESDVFAKPKSLVPIQTVPLDALSSINTIYNLKYCGNAKWIVYGTNTDSDGNVLFKYISTDNSGMWADQKVQSLLETTIRGLWYYSQTFAQVVYSTFFYDYTNKVYRGINMAGLDMEIGFSTAGTGGITATTANRVRTFYEGDSALYWQKIIPFGNAFIGLVSTINAGATSKTLKGAQSFVLYLNVDSNRWYGGYTLQGYYSDLAYANGALHVAGWTEWDDSLWVPNIMYGVIATMTDNGVIGVFRGYPDLYYMQQSINQIPNAYEVNNNTALSYCTSSIACSVGSVVGLFSYKTGSSESTGIIRGQLDRNTYVWNTIKKYTGWSNRVVSASAGVYYFVINSSADTYVYYILFNSLDSGEVTDIGGITLLAQISNYSNNPECALSEYDPYNDVIYLIEAYSSDIKIRGLTGFTIGGSKPGDKQIPLLGGAEIDASVKNPLNAAQLSNIICANGRYIFNKGNNNALCPHYGIMPFFNKSPDDEKPITKKGTSTVLPPMDSIVWANNRVFIIANGELYISYTRANN